MTQKDLTTTTQLVRDYQGGDRSALDVLYGRYMPMLRRWASGRLPPYGRDVAETEDLVQMAFMRAFKHMDTFEVQHPGSFLVYLRSIMMNLVRDELRRKKVRPQAYSVLESLPDTGTSVVEAAVGAEMLANYERALSKLPEEKRSAVMMRIEFDLSYEEIASELELPSANATRMMISRALVELARHMQP
jgi:RNA polymerase sigma-70 factor (ECF subfamily)